MLFARRLFQDVNATGDGYSARHVFVPDESEAHAALGEGEGRVRRRGREARVATTPQAAEGYEEGGGALCRHLSHAAASLATPRVLTTREGVHADNDL